MNEIAYVVCSCGVKIVTEILDVQSKGRMTKEENEKYQCSQECCATLYVCSKCSNRIIIVYEAPDATIIDFD